MKFIGKAALLGSGEGEMYEDDRGRTWIATCGCVATSGKAHPDGMVSELVAIDYCYRHAWDAAGHLKDGTYWG